MLTKLSTIVVDENKVSRKNLASLMRNSLGIKDIMACENDNLALHYIKDAKNVDLVLIDYETTNDKTFDFIEKTKSCFPENEVKFILLAKTSSKEFLLEAAGKGVSSFVLKPYNSATIVKNINSLYASKSQRKSNRLKLLEAVPAILNIEDDKFDGALIDISSGGCQIKTSGFDRKGVEIYDMCQVEIPFEDTYIILPSELIRLEKDRASDKKDVLSALIFEPLHKDNALKFAQLWASLLKYSSK